MYNFPGDNFPKVRLGCNGGPCTAARMVQTLGGRAPRLDQAGGRALRLGQTWEIATWEIVHFGSCHLGKILWESTITSEFSVRHLAAKLSAPKVRHCTQRRVLFILQLKGTASGTPFIHVDTLTIVTCKLVLRTRGKLDVSQGRFTNILTRVRGNSTKYIFKGTVYQKLKKVWTNLKSRILELFFITNQLSLQNYLKHLLKDVIYNTQDLKFRLN